jgi:hypothetical protein
VLWAERGEAQSINAEIHEHPGGLSRWAGLSTEQMTGAWPDMPDLTARRTLGSPLAVADVAGGDGHTP